MENIILSELHTRLAGIADKDVENSDYGGVAVWEIPPKIATAYNPLIFRRGLYYVATDRYLPARDVLYANYSQVDVIVLRGVNDEVVDVDIYVKVALTTGEEILLLSAGTSEVVASDQIVSILGVSLTYNGPYTPYLITPNCYCIFPITLNGATTTLWPVVDDGYLLTTQEADVLYINDMVGGVSLVVSDSTTQESAELEATSYKGFVEFDIAPIIRAWFAGELAEVNINNLIEADSALYVAYEVNAFAGVQFMGVNGVVQIGESTDLTDKEGTVLTTKPRLVYYKGYPLDYTVLSGAEGVVTPNGNTEAYAISRVNVLSGMLLLLTEVGVPILTEAGENIYIYSGEVSSGSPIEVLQRCVPSSPFYVRWINTEGGVDYWMFERYQERVLGVSNIERGRVYVGNPSKATTNVQMVGFGTTNEVTVGAELVGKGDFDALRKLALSPLIEWWNERTERWVRLTVARYELKYAKEGAVRNFDITFALPDLYTQQEIW